MIKKIGVLCQDRNSFGFLLGLKRRLQCDAELIEPTTGGLAKSTKMTSRQSKLATRDLQKKGVDLIVRFTDADRSRWQEVERHEKGVFPDKIQSILVCGVAVENTELWLALDRNYLATELDLKDLENAPTEELTDLIKNAIARQKSNDEPVSEYVARLVERVPSEVFKRWLSDVSLRKFYQVCRSAANLAQCEVPNEMDG